MKKIVIVIIIFLLLQISAGLVIYFKSEIEYAKLYVPSIDNISTYNTNISFTIYGKDNVVMYRKYYKRQEKLKGSYPMMKVMPMIDIIINQRHQSIKETGIERWKKIILNNQGIDPFSLEGAAYVHYTDMLISKSDLKGPKKELVRWYTIDKLHNQYSQVGLSKLLLDSSSYAENIYGIAAASKYYFNKEIENVSMLELAFLLSCISWNNNATDAVKNYQELDRKARNILYILYKNKDISEEEYNKNMAENITFQPEIINTVEPSYVHAVLKQIENIKEINDNLGKVNVSVYTGYDDRANKIVREVLKDYYKDKDDEIQAAFVLLNNKTQEVISAIGSRRYDTKVNRALTISRQMASTFKPIVFLSAFEKGIRPSDQVVDMPYEFVVKDVVYKPNNYNGFFMGKIPIRYAFVYSLNNSTIKVAEMAGLKYVRDVSISLGMNKDIQPFYAMALGAFPATPMTVAQMFSTIGNLGEYKKATLATSYKIGDKEYSLKEPSKQVVSKEAAYQTLYIMQAVASRGTARGARLLKGTGAKTGTSNDARDAWTVAVFGDYTAVIWVGYDDLRPITIGGSGGRLAAPIIAEFQRRYFGKNATFSFQVPDNIVFKRVDARTGLLTNRKSSGTYIEAYNKKRLPKSE